MTHLLIGWRAEDLIVINGRGPAWPAPQRSVVITIIRPKPIRLNSPLDMPLASLSEKSLLYAPFGAQRKLRHFWTPVFESCAITSFPDSNLMAGRAKRSEEG